MKRVLLTGAGGFIGSHALEHFLVKTEWELICPVTFRHKGVPERIVDSKHYQANQDRVTIFTHDLTAPFSPVQLKRLEAEGGIDYVVNFASESHVDRSITEPVPFIRNNVECTLNLLELARELKPRAFVQVSTDEVYGPALAGTRHAEWSTIIPSNPYSASKAAQEAIAISYWRTYGVPVVITNTMNNIGERQDPEKFVPKVMRAVLNGEAVTVHGGKGAIGSRFYLHARNHADAILFLLQRVKPVLFPYADRPDRFNVVGDVELNNLELAQKIAGCMGRELKYRLEDFHSTRPGHDLRYALDGSKLAALGWRAPVDFDASLRKTVEWTMENPEWLGLRS